LPARILNGNAIRDQIYAELAGEIAALSEAGVRPGLAAVRVGDDPASKLYVNSKIAACEKLGLASFHLTPPASTTTEELLAIVDQLNNSDEVDGILVQMPLPKQIDAKKILDAISPAKDVDGFHPVNVGHLVAGRPSLVACTPAGVMEILRRSEIPIEGANAVVIGRSDIVGKPMALLLLHANATVTICHSKSRDLPAIARKPKRSSPSFRRSWNRFVPKAPCWWATCIRKWRRWPERSRPFLAALVH
jgi:methylenetetrahydrofolate dehydrogenase (NADP+)/methenyltetrahydrofolate cyclohydrolase